MSTQIDKALLDVRKAYRLLADYQQRVLELLSFIREELGASYYYQHFRNKLPRSLDQLERREDGGEKLLPAYSTRWRTRFHADGGRCSSVMADTVPR